RRRVGAAPFRRPAVGRTLRLVALLVVLLLVRDAEGRAEQQHSAHAGRRTQKSPRAIHQSLPFGKSHSRLGFPVPPRSPPGRGGPKWTSPRNVSPSSLCHSTCCS